MKRQIIKNTCLYIHTRKSDGTIFYVGIGDGGRPYGKNGRNRYWHYTVNKYGYNVVILVDDLTCELEVLMIAFYGRKDKVGGILVNMTDGGEGANGCTRSEETKQKMRNIWTVDLREKKRLENIGEGNGMYGRSLYDTMVDKNGKEETDKKWGQMIQEKREQMLTNNPHKNPEVKIKISNSLKGKTKTEEHRKNLSISAVGRVMDNETKEKISLKSKGSGNGRSILTEDNVRFIRQHYKPYSKEYGMKQLANMFGVSIGTIDGITRNVTWVDVV
jgi:hypothetical protein